MNLPQEPVSFALQSCLSAYMTCEQPLATISLTVVSAKYLLGWIPSLTKPSQVFLTLALPQNYFCINSHCSLLASIFVSRNFLTEGKKVPAASTPVPELESMISEQCQTFPSLIRAVWVKLVLPCVARCCIVLPRKKASNLGCTDRIPNGITKLK